MRNDSEQAGGVTYIGPRAFVVAFCVVSGMFLGLLFGLNRISDSVAAGSSDNASTGLAQDVPSVATPTGAFSAVLPIGRIAIPSPGRAPHDVAAAHDVAPAKGTRAKASPQAIPLAQTPDPSRVLPSHAVAPVIPRPAKIAVHVASAHPSHHSRSTGLRAVASASAVTRQHSEPPVLVPFNDGRLNNGRPVRRSTLLAPNIDRRGLLVVTPSAPALTAAAAQPASPP